MNPIRIIVLTIFSIQALAGLKAEQRLELSMGHQTSRCTYLSPLAYSGSGYGLSYEWLKPTWHQDQVWMRTSADIDYGYLLSPAKNSRMYTLNIRLGWGAERKWGLGHGFSLFAGGTAGIDAGVMYLPRNGNNPAQALAWIGASGTLKAEYTGLKLLKKPLLISWQMEIPTIGAFFCPAYGETYYEIYLGNHSGLAHFGWWGNRPQVKTNLKGDWKLGQHWLTIGFEYIYSGLECNAITTRTSGCNAIVGLRF